MCQHEQLHLIIVDEKLSVKMFNVINHQLRIIKHIQSQLFSGSNVNM
jgi:hypothetical protein